MLACNSTQPTPNASSSLPGASHSPAPQESAAEADIEPGASDPRNQLPLPIGCYSETLSTLTEPLSSKEIRERTLAQLARACAPQMRAHFPGGHELKLGSNEPQALPFMLDDASRCLRVLGVTDGGQRVRLVLKNKQGDIVAENSPMASVALLNQGGPLCLSEPGEYQVHVSSLSGPAQITLQIMLAEATEHPE